MAQMDGLQVDSPTLGNVWKNSIIPLPGNLKKYPQEHKFAPSLLNSAVGKENPAFFKSLLAGIYVSGKAIWSRNSSVLKSSFNYVFIEYWYFFNTPYLPLKGHYDFMKVLHSSSTLTQDFPHWNDSFLFLCICSCVPKECLVLLKLRKFKMKLVHYALL